MTLASQILARRMRLTRPQTLDLVTERDLRAQMDDGVELLADRWVARARASLPQPTVLVRSPYGRRQLVGMLFGRLLAERGLQVVIQSVRGTFGSGGEFAPFDERADGLATLRWLRAQPWHSGPVGTVGASYLGFVQWAMAANAGDQLAAMSIHVSASQFHSQTYTGGVLSLETLGAWLVIIAAQERRFAPLAVGRALRGLGTLLGELPLRELRELDERATGAQVAWFREGFSQPERDSGYWTARDFSASVPEVTARAQFVGGWYDILLPWMLADYEAMQAAGRSPQLLIGPWVHTSPTLMSAAERESIAWLRAHLLGDDRLLRSANVRLMVTGERAGGGWREFDVWPPPGTVELTLYPGANGSLSHSPPPVEPVGVGDRYRYDPADPTPSLGGPGLLARDPVVDNAPLESRPDVHTYTGARLREPLEAIGHVRVALWVRASVPYFDLFARVCDIGSDGVSRNVCDGIERVSPVTHGRSADGSWLVEFELWPIAHRFAAGNRIRLQVSSGAHPRYARNPGTGEDVATATAATMRAVEIELLRDAAHPSVLVLPEQRSRP